MEEAKQNIPVNKLHAEAVDPGMVENIRCKSCTKYFFPPIFLCGEGHNLCNCCTREQLVSSNKDSNSTFPLTFGGSGQSVFTSSISPIAPLPKKNGSGGVPFTFSNMASASTPTLYFCGKCEEYVKKIDGSRNAAMERSIKFLTFLCGNAASNCVYRNTLFLVEEHEKTCIYASMSCCIPECTWKGTGLSIKSHLQEHHTCLSLCKPELIQEGINKYPILFDDRFFLLKTNYKPCNHMSFSVACLGDNNKYMFELGFLGDNEHIGIKLSNYCEPLLNKVAKGTYECEFIPMPLNCLKHFVTDLSKLRFFINIVKIE